VGAGDAGRYVAYMKTERDILLAQWERGARTSDVALRLLFFSWYPHVEPLYLTGLDGRTPEGVIEEAFECIGGEEAWDAEALFVVAVMAEVAPWCFGDERRWRRVADNFWARLGGVIPAPEVFAGRGAYGEYFAHQARVQSRGAT
jgi:hypothetical protein